MGESSGIEGAVMEAAVMEGSVMEAAVMEAAVSGSGGGRARHRPRCSRDLMVGVLAGAVILIGGGGSSTELAAQANPVPATLTAADFAGIAWLEGRWLGSGGGYDAFYEAYRMVNDSTMEQTTYPDEGFGEPDGRSLLEFRNGQVHKSRDGRVESMITGLAGDTIRFDRPEPGRGGFSWIRVSDDEWQAILDRGNRDPVVYTLRRIR